MSNLKLAGALAAVVGTICLVLVQFLPWGGIETEGGSVFGFSFPGADVDSYTWHLKANGETEGWYSDDFEDDDGSEPDGLSQIRVAVPFLLAGLVVGAIGAVLTFGRGAAGPIVALVGGLLATVGLVLFAMGTSSFYDSEHDWAASFYLAIAGCAAVILGGVLGLMAGNQAARGA